MKKTNGSWMLATSAAACVLLRGVAVAAADPPGDTPSCHPQAPAAVSTPAACPPDHSPAAAVAASATPADTERATLVDEGKDPEGGHWRTILFKNFLIDRIYPSMKGPWNRTYVADKRTFVGEGLWLTRYRAEVLDGSTGAASQEFMCHTNLDLVQPEAKGSYRYLQSQLSISQGQKEIVFPEGFALRIDGGPNRAIDVNAMVLNNNDADIHRFLDFKVTMNYEDDGGAARRHLVPLFQGAISGSCLTDASAARPGEAVCRAASDTADVFDLDGRRSTGHWVVPPGRQMIAQRVEMPVPLDTTVHYIWMHVHPYAESIELRDLTAGQTLFKGRVANDAHRAAVLGTDRYSNPAGMPVFRDHRYELVTVYNNTTSHDVDAMSALWMYFRGSTEAQTVASK